MNNIVSNKTASPDFFIEPLRESPILFLHCAIFISSKRIISDETFRLESFQGKEAISSIFEYQLELNANTEEAAGNAFTFDEILGCPITVGIQYPAQSKQGEGVSFSGFSEVIRGADPGDDLVLFSGIVTSFSIKNRGTYQITMKPALHKLSLTNHYRVYSQKSLSDMIKTLLDSQQISYEPFNFSSQNLAVIRTQDWFQAGETDFDFLQRLLAKAHVYYHFKHTVKNHSLIFSNVASYNEVFKDKRPLRYDFTSAESLGLNQCDLITEYNLSQTMNSTGVSGVLTKQGAAWEHNRIVPFVSYQADDSPSVGALPFHLYKSYQYGGSADEVEDVVDAVKSALSSASTSLSGTSLCAYFKVAHSFRLKSGADGASATNPAQVALERDNFVLTSVSHHATADGQYQNQFQATNANYLITPYSLQETQQGSLLAIVVAHGASSVQDPTHFGAPSSFDPESNQFLDTLNVPQEFQQQGVFVIFATDPNGTEPVWVKISASMQTVPTIGAIVQVARAQDESELPEIQNIIQANGSMQVIPAGWLANTHVGSSYSTNYGDSRSINYGATSDANLQQATAIVNQAYDSNRFDSVGFTQGTNYSFSCANSLASGASHSDGELYGTEPIADDIISASESYGSTYNRQHANTTRSFSNVVNAINISNAAFTTNVANTGITTNVTNSGMTHNVSTSAETTNISTSGSTINVTTTGLTLNTNISGLTKNITLSGNTWNSTTTGDLVENSLSGNTVRTSVSGDLTETITAGNTIRTSTTGNLTETITAGIHTINGVVATKEQSDTSGASVNTTTSGTTTNTISTGDTNNIVTTGMTSNINTTGEHTQVETAGPGTMVSTRDAQPHIDNIVTRVTMVEATVVFM